MEKTCATVDEAIRDAHQLRSAGCTNIYLESAGVEIMGDTELKFALPSQNSGAASVEVRHSIEKITLLTERELVVFDALVAGQSNKETARALGISPRTVELHRARILAKTDSKNLADLVWLAAKAGRT